MMTPHSTDLACVTAPGMATTLSPPERRSDPGAVGALARRRQHELLPRTAPAAADDAAPHRDRCQHWIESARCSGDVEALVSAVCAAADDSLLLDDLQEASWYVERGLAALGCLPMGSGDQPARWALAELALAVAQCWRAQGDAARGRRLQDLLRDACFDTVRHAEALRDVAARRMLYTRVAALLDHLGDATDADLLRRRAGG
jgi:hypothetical protein